MISYIYIYRWILDILFCPSILGGGLAFGLPVLVEEQNGRQEMEVTIKKDWFMCVFGD